MKTYIRNILRYFSIIYTIASIGAAIFITLDNRSAVLGVGIFWGLLLLCFICSLVSTFILESEKECSKKQAISRIIIHIIIIYGVIFCGGLICEWITIRNIGECLGFSLMFFVIYAGIWIAMYKRDNKEAQEFNKRIKYFKEEKED